MNGTDQRSSRARFASVRYLLKTGLFRSNRADLPAKESMVREGLVLAAGLLVGLAMLILVLLHH